MRTFGWDKGYAIPSLNFCLEQMFVILVDVWYFTFDQVIFTLCIWGKVLPSTALCQVYITEMLKWTTIKTFLYMPMNKRKAEITLNQYVGNRSQARIVEVNITHCLHWQQLQSGTDVAQSIAALCSIVSAFVFLLSRFVWPWYTIRGQ